VKLRFLHGVIATAIASVVLPDQGELLMSLAANVLDSLEYPIVTNANEELAGTRRMTAPVKRAD
jgi:hypothetical protein